MLIAIWMFMLLIGVVTTGIRLAWGFMKFVFGLGLFWFCPVLFLIAVLLGAFSHTWILILVVGLLCGRKFFTA